MGINIFNNKKDDVESRSLTGFVSNKIFLDSETISEQLKKAREEKRFKLADVAKRLNIKYEYLEALENHEFWKLPKGVYGKNFLREYAIFLKLNYREILEVFEKEVAVKTQEKEQHLFSTQIVKKLYFLALPKIFRNIIIAFIVLICFAYLGFRINKIVSPPFLTVNSPEENLIIEEKTVEVSGVAEIEAQLFINGEIVLSDARGIFYKKVDLKNGVNIIIITAKKKYGRANTIQRQVLVKESDLQL